MHVSDLEPAQDPPRDDPSIDVYLQQRLLLDQQQALRARMQHTLAVQRARMMQGVPAPEARGRQQQHMAMMTPLTLPHTTSSVTYTVSLSSPSHPRAMPYYSVRPGLTAVTSYPLTRVPPLGQVKEWVTKFSSLDAQPVEESKVSCLICCQHKRQIVLGCGHMPFCPPCAAQFFRKTPSHQLCCPTCRQRIVSASQFFDI